MAGERSSPVLRDRRMETGNKKTIYIFNLKRGEIIEYALEIVEQKLRELKADESGYINELEAGYKKARRTFKRRAVAKRSVADSARILPREAVAYSENDDLSKDDSDIWLESMDA